MDQKYKALDKSAKMTALKELRKLALDMINQQAESHMKESSEEKVPSLDKMQKVTVAAPDKEGLKKGLEKAEEILEQLPSKEPKEEIDELEDEEESDEDSLEAQEAELLAKLKEIQAKKAKKA